MLSHHANIKCIDERCNKFALPLNTNEYEISIYGNVMAPVFLNLYSIFYYSKLGGKLCNLGVMGGWPLSPMDVSITGGAANE